MRRAQVGSMVLAAALAACASQPKPPAGSSTPQSQIPAQVGLSVEARLKRVSDLLEQGDSDNARVEALQLLKEDPSNREGQLLLRSIDEMARVMLGDLNFDYTLKRGETLSTVAKKFLGDPNLFYALAKYNGISRPDVTGAGSVIMVPGARPGGEVVPPSAGVKAEAREQPRSDAKPEAKAESKAPADAPRSGPETSTPAASPAKVEGRREVQPDAPKIGASPATSASTGRPQAAPPAKAPAQAPARDPERANALRGEALLQMDRGAIDQAVSLLQAAVKADPENAPAKSDLERALRIQHAAHP